MRKILIAVAAAFGLSLLPSSARADLAPPVPPVKDVKFVVEVDDKAKAPKLIVPQNLTTVRIRPRPGGAVPPKAVPPGKDDKGGEQLSYIELESSDNTPIEPAPRNPNHLMIAGVALALSLGFGGVWLIRRQGRMGTPALAIMLAAGGSLAVTTLVWANAAPPPVKPPPAKERVLLPVAFNGNVSLEVTVGGDTIRLVLDKETYEKLKEKPQEPERK
jgi:hypothetical protein